MFEKAICSIILVMISFSIFSQKEISKKELKLYHKIYEIVIDSFLGPKPCHFVLIDSTDNRFIQESDFLDYADQLRLAKKATLDSSWLIFLVNADSRKKTLSTIKLQQTKSIHTIRLFNRDSLFKIQEENHFVGRGIIPPYGWVDGYMTLSTPILSKGKDKAIVEINCTRDTRDARGDIFLLEKRKDGKWVIAEHMRVSVS